MKKRTKLTSNQVGIISGIGTFILILFIIIGANIYYQSKTDYVITKQECHNETVEDRVTFPQDFNSISCPEVLLETVCYDGVGNIIEGLKCTKWGVFCFELKDKMIYEGVLVQEGRKFTWYTSGYFFDETGMNYILPSKGKIQKQVCETKEVEEIIFDDSKFLSDCHHNCFDIYNKKWLDNNCECLNKKDYFGDIYDDCIQYKCQDYEVIKQ